ncbi:MAG: aminopeptidase [Planctomycetota bacterium]
MPLLGCIGPYHLRQAAGEIRILASARPIADVLVDPVVPASVRAGLTTIESILDYARAHGFHTDGAYSSFVDLGARPAVYVLSAARPDELALYTWSFPFVGRFPYKGYFDRDAARRGEQKLKADGYETLVGGTAAFSTLGWLPDPVFSSFLNGSIGDRAELLFHELTHRTVFFADDVAFNESLATFIGYKTAVTYLTATYGEESAELREHVAAHGDAERLAAALARARAALEVAFRAPERDTRLAARERIFTELTHELASTDFESAEYQAWRRAAWSLPLLLSFDLYRGEVELFERAWRACGGDVARLLATLQQMPTHDGGGVARLRTWLKDVDG